MWGASRNAWPVLTEISGCYDWWSTGHFYTWEISCRVWLAKCCKIQQLAHSYSTTYIYVQQDILIFNILYLYSTTRIFFQLQPNYFHSTKIFQLQPNIISFNKYVCSTSTKNNFIQQQYLFNFNPNYFHSTKIITQLQPEIISFNNEVPGHSKYRHSTKFPVPPTELPHSLPASKGRLWTGAAKFVENILPIVSECKGELTEAAGKGFVPQLVPKIDRTGAKEYSKLYSLSSISVKSTATYCKQRTRETKVRDR